MAAVAVDTTFDVEAREGTVTTVRMAGADVRVVDEPPIGALIVFTRRLQSSDMQAQLGSILELCDKWIHPDDLDALYDAVGSLHAADLEGFMEKDLTSLIEVVSSRPTMAQSS